jgi:hypothetical protein
MAPEKLFLPAKIQPSPYGTRDSDGDKAKGGGKSPLLQKKLRDAAKG